MTHAMLRSNKLSGARPPVHSHFGFTVMEMLVSICILLPIMAAALKLFTVGVNQQSSEQSSVEANQDATAGFNLMKMEIAQAGSHDIFVETQTISTITGSDTYPQSVAVDSTSGLNVGDYIDLVDGIFSETVQITGLSSSTITALFLYNHGSGTTIRFFGFPYTQGVLPPSGISPNSDTPVTRLRFFGDIYGDGNLYYAEYVYDSNNARITRSLTPFTSNSKAQAEPLITHITPGTARFILHTDQMNVITSVTVSLTVENQWETASNLEEIELSSRIAIPSAEAASGLMLENMHYQKVNKLPPVPSRIAIYSYGVDTYAQ